MTQTKRCPRVGPRLWVNQISFAAKRQIPYFTARKMAEEWGDQALAAGDAVLDRLRRHCHVV